MRKEPPDASLADRLFAAIAVSDVRKVRALLAEDAEIASLPAVADHLFDQIPHWLYVGDTPLHLASAALADEIVEVLLAAGGDAKSANRRGATALHYGCDPRPQLGVWNPEKQARIIDLLVAGGAAVNSGDEGGATPLHRATRARSATAVQRLLFHGADTGARLSRSGSTPLHVAVSQSGASGTRGARKEQLEIVAALLKRGANPLDMDSRGRSVLSVARDQQIKHLLLGAI